MKETYRDVNAQHLIDAATKGENGEEADLSASVREALAEDIKAWAEITLQLPSVSDVARWALRRLLYETSEGETRLIDVKEEALSYVESQHGDSRLREQARRDEEQAALLAAERARLQETANRPIDYESPPASGSETIAPQQAYVEFAALLRQHGIDERTVFDLVVRLSDLVRQCEKVVPQLSSAIYSQLEARVFVEYEQRKSTASLAAEQARLTAKDAEERDQILMAMAHLLEEIVSQLGVLSNTSQQQARTVSTMKTLQLIDGFFDSLNHR